MSKVALAVLGAAIFAHACWLSLAFGKSADQANLLLAGIDMLHGNWRLSGWSMVADSYWTSDVAFGAILSLLRRLAGRPELSPVTLVVQPALCWAAVGLASISVAQHDLKTRTQRWIAALIVLATCSVPCVRADGALPLAFLSGIHLLTVVYALGAFTLAQAALLPASSGWRVWALAGLCAAGQAGDPFFLFIGTVPTLLGLATAATTPGRRRAVIGSCVLAATLAGFLLVLLNAAGGGFTVGRLPAEFASPHDLGENLAVTARGLMSVFSADVFSRPLLSDVPEFLHLPLMILAILAAGGRVFLAGRGLMPGQAAPAKFMEVCLAAAFACDVAALVFSRRIEYEAGSIATARYLFPAWIFGSVLLARRGANHAGLGVLASAAALSALVCNVLTLRPTGFPALNANEQLLLGILQSQPVRMGLSGYWQAGLLRVASGGRLFVGACVEDPDGHLAPFRQVSRGFSIAEVTGGPFFVIVQHRRPFFVVKDVVRQFGPPASVREAGDDFTVMFYRSARPA